MAETSSKKSIKRALFFFHSPSCEITSLTFSPCPRLVAIISYHNDTIENSGPTIQRVVEKNNQIKIIESLAYKMRLNHVLVIIVCSFFRPINFQVRDILLSIYEIS